MPSSEERSRYGWEAATEERSFDELAKGVASGSLSRGRALKILAGGALAALFGWGIAVEEAAAQCKGNFCKDILQRCGPRDRVCFCHRTPGGGNRCAAPSGECQSCKDDRDCPTGHHCVQNGKNCCGGRRKYVCAVDCSQAPSSA